MPDQEPEEQNDQESQEQTPEGGTPLVHPLDPDFLLFALPYAVLLDILTLFPVVGTIVSLIFGAPLVLWMISKGGQAPSKKGMQQHQAQRQAAKAATRRALKRGVLVFIAELIPLLNLLPFWLIAVLMMLRQKSEPASSADKPALPAGGPALSPA